MKVLYYLEPWLELDFPFFRLGTVRNHLRKEAAALIRSGCAVTLITSDTVKKEVDRLELLPAGIDVIGIDSQDLLGLSPNYLAASLNSFRGDLESASCVGYLTLLKVRLDSFVPDVIIAYETAFSALLRKGFEDSLVIDSTLGSFSREPYPETFCYDPFGSFSRSALSCFSIDELNPNISDSQASSFLQPLRAMYGSSLAAASPFNVADIRKHFSTVLLLPLQVSNYFAFDACLPAGVEFTSQFEYLCWVMDRVPSDIGVVVTEHGFSHAINERNAKWLTSRYENLIYVESHRQIRWSSQYLLNYVDGVITVSSSVGFQAAFYNKFLLVIGQSHLTAMADMNDISRLQSHLVHEPKSKSRYSHFLLTRYNPLFEDHVLSGDWFASKLARFLELHRSGLLKADIFEPLDDCEEIQRKYINSCRPCAVEDKGAKKSRKNSIDQDAPMSNTVKYSLPSKQICKNIDVAEIVSFDIFDTLLIRKFNSPASLNLLIADKASLKLRDWGYSLSAGEYSDARRKAANTLLKRARHEALEDVTLREIYNELRKNIAITKDQAANLRKIEMAAEFRCLERRKSVFSLYNYALQKGKRIYFVSDMYLDEDFVCLLLEKHGYDSYEKLLLSSAVGKLKKTGRLYDDLISLSGAKAEHIYHIGDNKVSDFDRAIEKNIKATHISKVTDKLLCDEARSVVYAQLPNDVWFGLQKGIAAKYIERHGRHMALESLSGGSAYMLGVLCAGPIVLAFAQWIYRMAVSAGIEHIYFLARDGWYPRKAFDAIASHCGGGIRSSYMLASRRSVIGSALHNENDVYDSLNASFSSCTVEFFLRHRFGLEPEAYCTNNDYLALNVSHEELLNSKDDFSVVKLKTILSVLMPQILSNAMAERKAYRCYLEGIGFDSSQKSAIVDIGHNGTLQKGLGALFNRAIVGYYFATFEKAKDLLLDGHEVNSYLLAFEPNKKSEHFYCRNIGMFEFLFIPDKKSFVRMNLDQAGVHESIFVEIEESRRCAVAGQIEKGIDDYCADFITTLGEDLLKYSPSPERAVLVFRDFIENPKLEDADVVKDVFFVDGFGGSERRYLIDPEIFTADLASLTKDAASTLVRNSWWREGARALLHQGRHLGADPSSVPRVNLNVREKFFLPFFRPFVRILANKHNNRQFEASPRDFFSGLSNKYYKRLGAMFFGPPRY